MVGQALKMAVELRRLRQRWQVELYEPPPVQLAPPISYACVLEGHASTCDVDLDHVRFAPFAVTWGSSLVPLVLHHDFDRPAGKLKDLSYTKEGGVWAVCHPNDEGARYGAFSIAGEILSYELHHVDTPHFYSLVTSCELKELSFVTRPVNVQALIKERYPLFDPGKFYDLATAKITRLQQLIKKMEGSTA